MPYRTRARRVDAVDQTKPKDIRFWLHDEPHKAVMASWNRIGSITTRRRSDDLYYACLYDDSEFAAMLQGAGAVGEYTPQTMTSNICKRQVDTYVASIVKNRPKPMGLTSGGNYSQQRRAKSLSKLMEGQLDESGYYDTRELRLRDQAVWGDGFALNYRVGRTIKHDRFYPWEIRVDPRDAYYGKPKTFFLGRYIDRLVVKETWPGYDEIVDKAAGKAPDDIIEPGWDDTSDQVLVVWAWHLRSGETADDGRFVTCVSEGTIADGSYERDYPPFSKNAFSPPQIGWRGEGMVKQLAGLQYEVNAIGLLLQERHYLTGSYVLIEDGSGVEMDIIDNGTLSEVRWRGSKPDFAAPNAANPELMDYYMKLRGQFPAEESRISQLSTHGEIPSGMRSGKAQRVYKDIEAQGFIPQGRSDERDCIDTAWQFFDLSEEIYGESLKAKAGEKREKYVVRVEERKHGKSSLEAIDYKDVRLDREQFTLRVFPTAFLSSSPAERYDDVKEMVDGGFLTQDEAMALMDLPDTEGMFNLRGSQRRNVMRTIEKILEAKDPNAEGVFMPPQPQMKLDAAIVLATEMYWDAKLDGAPEDNLLAVIDWIDQARAMMTGEIEQPAGSDDPNAGAPDAAPPPMPGPGGPPGPQYAPPTGPLLPPNAVAPTAIPNLPPGA